METIYEQNMHNIRYNCRLLCRGIFIKNTQIIRYYCDETVKKLNLLFFGTDKFSLPSLVTLNEARYIQNITM